ncbi:MAG: M48 family metallopeptidase [Victivallaceae bacterium]|jgi:STE24 endopeptidase
MKYELAIIIIFYFLTQLADFILEYMNRRYLEKHGAEIPPEFKDVITPELMERSKNYTIAKTKYWGYSTVYNQLITLIFIFGILNYYNNYLFDCFNSYKDTSNFILGGLVFMMVLTYAKTFLNLPLNLYRVFNLEKRFGFNTMTFKLWLLDILKGFVVSSILLSIMIVGAFWLIERLPEIWWLPVWGFFVAFTIFVIYISPYVLEPLFNKFTPIEDKALEKEIESVLEKGGITVRGVYRMDASKRTKHSNAYFTGLGRVKRIVLFDTLLERLNKEEILAVLAHEAGHCKKRHVLKNLIIFETLTAPGAFIAFLLLEKSNWLTRVFGLTHDTFFAKFILLSFVATIVLWGMPPFFNAISRHFEKQADKFVVRIIGSGEALASALVKLSAENLSNIHPQKLYAKFHYSHPPLLQRIRYLKRFQTAETKKSSD